MPLLIPTAFRTEPSPVCSASLLCRSGTLSLAIVSEEGAMIFDYSLAGLVTLGLLFYLTYALLRPERF